jgi:lipopolysaccharide/colanic/teichoic acid biosynthesis glycosyltransferase
VLEQVRTDATGVSRRAPIAAYRVGLPPASRRVKRASDVIGAAALLVLAAPLLAAIAVAIKLDSPGPVLFRQTRVGKGGRPFRMLKFRTMVDGAEALRERLLDLNESDGFFKIAADPRITRVGRILRRTSLDELPQLFNALRGEMSLVGPRPLVPEEDQRVEGARRRRLDLVPGMTGPWQIRGSSRVSLPEMVALDDRYVAEWSLWTDAKILLWTAAHVARRRGL